VGQILQTLRQHHLTENTLVMFTSDNGPVVDDGYRDDAVEKLGNHRPAGPWRGGKYSNFEGGTRIPWIVSWPGRVEPGRSSALVCQVDLIASFGALTGQEFDKSTAPDSENVLSALLGDNSVGRDHLVEQARTESLRQGEWKYIPPNPGARINRNTNTEFGSGPSPQLYHLEEDPAESTNVAAEQREVLEQLDARLQSIRQRGR
jgi:arylsulfatase A-like enzyme